MKQECLASRNFASVPGFFVLTSGAQENNRDLSGTEVGSEPLADFVSVHIRQIDVKRAK
jgi:hypothetical protein